MGGLGRGFHWRKQTQPLLDEEGNSICISLP
jgi:hypothetical protein